MIKKVYKIFSVFIGLILVYTIIRIVTNFDHSVNLYQVLQKISIWKILISCLAYFFSHFLRSLRIAVLLGRQDFSMISLITKQYYTNAINLVVPFKLGEFYRILEFNKLILNPRQTFLTVIAERALDFIFLFIGLFFSLYYSNYDVFDFKFTIVIGVLFIASVIFIYLVLPENIRSLNLFLAKRYKNGLVVTILATNYKIYSAIENIKQIVSEKPSTIFMLTLLIWVCEIFGFVFVSDYLSVSQVLLLSFLVFLSGLIPSASLGLGGLQGAFYLIFLVQPLFPHLELSIIYQLCIFLPAIFLGSIVYIIFKWRENRNHRPVKI